MKVLRLAKDGKALVGPKGNLLWIVQAMLEERMGNLVGDDSSREPWLLLKGINSVVGQVPHFSCDEVASTRPGLQPRRRDVLVLGRIDENLHAVFDLGHARQRFEDFLVALFRRHGRLPRNLPILVTDGEVLRL